ncbi:MAG: hypothetical protein MHM6MM_002115 [Cercozoa sp. M6MM]
MGPREFGCLLERLDHASPRCSCVANVVHQACEACWVLQSVLSLNEKRRQYLDKLKTEFSFSDSEDEEEENTVKLSARELMWTKIIGDGFESLEQLGTTEFDLSRFSDSTFLPRILRVLLSSLKLEVCDVAKGDCLDMICTHAKQSDCERCLTRQLMDFVATRIEQNEDFEDSPVKKVSIDVATGLLFALLSALHVPVRLVSILAPVLPSTVRELRDETERLKTVSLSPAEECKTVLRKPVVAVLKSTKRKPRSKKAQRDTQRWLEFADHSSTRTPSMWLEVFCTDLGRWVSLRFGPKNNAILFDDGGKTRERYFEIALQSESDGEFESGNDGVIEFETIDFDGVCSSGYVVACALDHGRFGDEKRDRLNLHDVTKRYLPKEGSKSKDNWKTVYRRRGGALSIEQHDWLKKLTELGDCNPLTKSLHAVDVWQQQRVLWRNEPLPSTRAALQHHPLFSSASLARKYQVAWPPAPILFVVGGRDASGNTRKHVTQVWAKLQRHVQAKPRTSALCITRIARQDRSKRRPQHLQGTKKYTEALLGECDDNDKDYDEDEHGIRVVPAAHMRELHSADLWMRELRRVRTEELARAPKTVAMSALSATPGAPVHLYGEWQTEVWQPAEATEGKVPRNARGTVDLFTPQHLPKGCVHLPYARILSAAKALKIDAAPALTRFDIRGNRSVPIYEGIVVCKQDAPRVLEKHAQLEKKRVLRERERHDKKMRAAWTTLFRTVFARLQVRNELSQLAQSVAFRANKPTDQNHNERDSNKAEPDEEV